MGHLDRQLNAGGGQLFDGLGLVFGSLGGVGADELFAVILQTQLVAYQLRVIPAVAGYRHSVGGVAVVLAAEGIDEVGAGQIVGNIQAVVQRQAEVLVGDGGVPVGVGRAILIPLIPAEVHLIGILGGAGFNQVVMELVVGVVVDGAQAGLVQVDVIQVAGREPLEGHVRGLNHLDGNGIEQLHVVLVPVGFVLGQHLFVLVHILGAGVGAVVPHGGVLSAEVAVHTDFLNQLGGQGRQAVVAGHRGEVAQLIHAVIDQGVIIGRFEADHFQELFSAQLLGFLIAQALGILIIFAGTLDHFNGHGGVGGLVLAGVQHPFKAGDPVLRSAVRLVVALIVHPGHALIELEDPGLAAIGGGPLLGNAGNQRAVGVIGEQMIVEIAQYVQIDSRLRIMVAPGLHFAVRRLVGTQILDLISGSREGDAGEHKHEGQYEGQILLHFRSSLLLLHRAVSRHRLCIAGLYKN